MRDYYQQNRDIIDKLDNRYAAALNRQLCIYRQFLQLDPHVPGSLERLLSRLRRFRQYRGNIIVGLIKPKGEIVYCLQPPSWFFLTGTRGGHKTLSLIGKYAMNREYREYFTQLERVDDLRDQPTDPAGGMANDLALHLSRARKQFFPILLERRKYLLYPDFWLDRQENSHAFLLLAHQWRFLETQFLNREIKRLNRLLADRGLRVRAVPDEHMPPWIQRDESLNRFHADLSQTRNPEYLIRPGGGTGG